MTSSAHIDLYENRFAVDWQSVFLKDVLSYSQDNKSSIILEEHRISRKAQEQLSKVRDWGLLEQNWDSYGASLINPYAINFSVDVIEELDRRSQDIYFVAPVPNGGVMIELKNGTKSIEMFIEDNLTSEVLKFEGEKCVEETTFSLNKVTSFIEWLNS